MILDRQAPVKAMKLIDISRLPMHKQLTRWNPIMKRAAILAVIPFVIVPSAMAEVPHTWRTYTNGRFGYSACYPADLLRPQPESPNGDGRAFVGEHGAKLLVWGAGT